MNLTWSEILKLFVVVLIYTRMGLFSVSFLYFE